MSATPSATPVPEHMRRAAHLAERAVHEETGGPFGAVVVRAGEVVGEGQNRVLSSADPTAHAELEAIRAAAARLRSFDLAGCELYASCEPCPMCFAAAQWARLDRIWFAGSRRDAAAAGFDDERFHEQLALAPQARTPPARAFGRELTLGAFDAWKARPDRRLY